MSETYVLVGSTSGNLMVPLILALFLLLDSLWSWRPGKRFWKETRYQWIVTGITFLVALTPVPGELLMVGGLAAFIHHLPANQTKGQKWVGSIIFLITLVSVGPFYARSGERIVLEQSTLRMRDRYERPVSIPLAGMELELQERPPLERIWGAGDWWISSEDRIVNRTVFGDSVYWGPRGMILGKDLGHRIANWAGTEPLIRSAAEIETY